MGTHNKAMSTGCNFDISHICDMFNNHPKWTLEDIAKKYQITEESLITWLKSKTGGDEEPRINQMLRQNDRRHKNAKNKQPKEHETSMEETIMSEISPKAEEEHRNLLEQISQEEQEIEDSKERVIKLKAIANASKQLVVEHSLQFKKIDEQIKLLEEKLKSAKSELEVVQQKLKMETEQYQKDCKAQKQAEEQLKSYEEALEFLNLELEELEGRTVYLIAPGYDINELPKELHGKLISTVEFDGVETEEPKKGVFNYDFEQVAEFCEEIGFNTLKSSRLAYRFALLYLQYKWSEEYEVYVLSNDERIHQLIARMS